MLVPMGPITVPSSDVEALSNSNICFGRGIRKLSKSNLLLGIQKDQRGIERLVLVNANICTIWNQILAFFGWGPLQKVDCKIKTVSQYLEKKWTQLSVSVKDDTDVQRRIRCIASRGKIKGALGLWEKAPLLLNDLNYLQKNNAVPYPLKTRNDKAAWLLAITEPPLVSSNDSISFDHLHSTLKKFLPEEYEETIDYFTLLKEISPDSPWLFEKLNKFPRGERSEAINIFKLLVEKFPQLETSDHSLLDLVLNTQQHLRSQIIGRIISLDVEKSQLSFKTLEYCMTHTEIMYRSIQAYSPDEAKDVSKFIACFPAHYIVSAKYFDDCYDSESREKRFIAFREVVNNFLAFPKEERSVIFDKLPAIIQVSSPWYLKPILSELKKIPPLERPSAIDGFIVVIRDNIVEFVESELEDHSNLFSNLLRIPIDEREDVCTKLCQVLKKFTRMSFFNKLLGGIGDTPKEARGNVINCIRSVFMQENVEIYPEIYYMVGCLSEMQSEKIKSRTDLYVFFKEMLYTPTRIDRVLKYKQFDYLYINQSIKDIPLSKRNFILTQLTPLHGKVRAYPLFSLFLVLSELSEKEGKKFFEALTLEHWQGILASMRNCIDKEFLKDRYASSSDVAS